MVSTKASHLFIYLIIYRNNEAFDTVAANKTIRRIVAINPINGWQSHQELKNPFFLSSSFALPSLVSLFLMPLETFTSA